MATPSEWLEGVRLRTLPASVAPVIAGCGIAWHEGSFNAVLAALALVVALAIQIASNFSNDYSDGIRGTDENRVGPLRLVGSGAATPKQVLAASLACYALAGLAGLAIVVLTQQWWLLALGVACFVAAWFYTGGKHPYGYLGLGEIFVFIFYGLVAVLGTVYIQVGSVGPSAFWASITIGVMATAILVANNLRDIPTDIASGKLTLATKLGDRGTRNLYFAMIIVAMVGVFGVAWTSGWWALLGWAMILTLVASLGLVWKGVTGPQLVGVLKQTGIAEAVCSVGMCVGLVLS
ncbi:MAG: 1,4-dihydroxy-2-naphthoate polyprenyltransferase [Propionibacteriaceae bacterium]|jgi:1,4-dihydroxy-2-naphthoate octaprenyltransferase|nr:1,4-dihydroxy-2-naphthoate polyprenyltransferase [Propionibacteriaceae bacterium]